MYNKYKAIYVIWESKMKKIIIFISMILSLMLFVGCSSNDISDMTGNTEEEVLEYLNKSDIVNSNDKNNIAIIDTIYVENTKIVAFQTPSQVGHVAYEEDKNGDYKMTDNKAEGINDLEVYSFAIRYNINSGNSSKNTAFITLSYGGNISSVEMSINDYTFNKDVKTDRPSMVAVYGFLSEEESKKIDFGFRYFDENNKEIEMNI